MSARTSGTQLKATNLGVDGTDVVGDGLASGSVNVRLVEAGGNTDDGDEELADEHAEGADDEQGTTSKALDGVERDGSRANVDDAVVRIKRATRGGGGGVRVEGGEGKVEERGRTERVSSVLSRSVMKRAYVKIMLVRKAFLMAPVDWRKGVLEGAEVRINEDAREEIAEGCREEVARRTSSRR